MANRFVASASDFRDQLLVLEPQWAAAVLVDQLRPIGLGLLHSEIGDSMEGFDGPQAANDSWSLKRSGTKLHSLLGTVVADPGVQAEKLRRTLANEPFSGTVLLCTTYLPPVSHPPSVVKRFYSGFGATDEGLKAILERLELERAQWLRHVKSCKRIDIFDRSQIEEYLEQPEYYQMRLTKDELSQQIERFIELLREPNYFVCLSPESIAMTFSVSGPEVEIRSDRRNKATPRAGRISGILLRDPSITESFEREFWSIFRTAPPEYRDKAHIATWLREGVSRYLGHDTVRTTKTTSFDLFLCHNSRDRDLVAEIAKKLKRRGVKVWFADWNLIPGRPWQRSLEAQISVIAGAAVFVGPSGLGPWSALEVEAFLQEFVKRGSPVIPAILPGVQDPPELPIFLKGMHWVDFRRSKPDPLAELIRGIRGE